MTEPGGLPNAGTVAMDVVPDADKFYSRLAGQVLPQADAIGRDIGKRLTMQMTKAIAQGMRDGIRDGGKLATPAALKAGDQAGAAYAKAFRARVDAAFKDPANIRVDADTAEAMAQITALSGEMAAFREEAGKPVNINVDAGDAAAKLAVIAAAAEVVDHEDPTVNVHVDDDNAEQELRKVGTAARTSTAGVNGLIAAGLALGPAIIPGAAAAAAAVAGIGAGAFSAVAGIGVIAIAVTPVISAIQAVTKAQDQSRASGASLTSQQRGLANSADQVRSAQAALANATANAADAQRRAAQQVADADQAVADAQRKVLQTQKDLTAAREAEVEAEQDLANQIKDGAIAQRQADLDVITSKQALDKVLADPTATKEQRAQAQITYDQAVQQVEDLKVRQQRLVAQQEQNTKTGVDGAAQVVAAQQKVVDAQAGVTKAEQDASNARIEAANQARQSAYSIAQAQQAVVQAQRAVQAASVQAGGASSAAADQARQAWAKLTPEGQRFATMLLGLKPVWTDLQHAAEAGFLPGAQAGIEALLPYVPRLTGFVGNLAHTVGDLTAEGGRLLASPFYSQFFAFLGHEAVQDVVLITHTLEGFTTGVAGTIQGLAPLSHLILTDVEGWSQRFARFGATVGRNQQFQQFVAYALRETPIFVHTLEDVASATGHIVVAAAPIGGFVLTALRDVSAVIEAIPTPVLTVLAAGIIGVTVATKGMAVAQNLATPITKAWGEAQKLLTAVIADSKIAMAEATVAGGGFTGAMTAMKTEATNTKGAVSGMVTAMGGPLGVAAIAAAVGLGAVTTAIVNEHNKVKDLTKAMLSLHDALEQAGDSNADTVKSIVDGNEDLQRAVRYSSQYGITTQSLIAALGGEKDAQAEVTAALNAKIEADKKQFSGFSLSPSGLAQLNRERELRDALKGTFQQLNANADINEILDANQRKTTDSTSKLTAADKDLYDRLDKLRTGNLDAADASDALKDAQDRLYGRVRGQNEATEAYYKAVNNLTDSIHDNGKALDVQSKAGLSNRDALQAALKASVDLYNADIASKVPMDQALQRHKDRITALLGSKDAAGLDKAAVQALVTEYGTVPSVVETQIKILGYADASGQLTALGQQIAALVAKWGIDAQTAANLVNSGLFQNNSPHDVSGRRKATGGLVSGPGTSTSDSIPLWASDGEYVQQAAAVDYYGVSTMNAINNRQVPRSALGFASGGLVGRSGIEIDHVDNIPPMVGYRAFVAAMNGTLDAVNNVLAGGLVGAAASGLPGNVTRWASTVAQALALLHQPVTLEPAVLRRINFESGGNQFAINLWDCVTLDTVILTRRGWLKHDEVRVGDETIGYNLATGKSEWTKVTRVVHYADAPLIRMGNSRWEATTTPNHRWINLPREYVKVGQAPDQCPLCEWPNLPGLRRRGATTKSGVKIHLSKVHGVKSTEPKSDRYPTQASWVTTADIRSRDRILLAAPADTPAGGLGITVAEAAILGWIAGDGHVETRKYGPSMSIAQSKPAMVEKLRELLADVPHADYVDERLTRTGKTACGPRHQFRLDHRYAQDLLRRAGHPKTDAVRQVLAMSTQQRAAWLEAIIDAEGHRAMRPGFTGPQVSISQNDGPVQEAILIAVYLAGHRPRVHRTTREDHPTWNPEASVHLNNPIITGAFLDKQDAGRGDVWCVTTELGSWTARDGDHVFLTGNSNAAAGHPSQGLMQTIPGTFNAYAGPYASRGIFDPLANIYAGLNYALHRYGSIQAIDPLVRPYGYDSGGWLMPGVTIAANNTGQPEAVFTGDQLRGITAAAEGRGHDHALVSIGTFVAGGQSPRQIADEISWQAKTKGR